MDNKKNFKIMATVTDIKGNCNAGHKKGDTFEISCYKSVGLCGFFYHNIFTTLSTYEYGGKYPWWRSEIPELKCPDPYNQISLKIEKVKIN